MCGAASQTRESSTLTLTRWLAQPGSTVVVSSFSGARVDECPASAGKACSIPVYLPPLPVRAANMSGVNGTLNSTSNATNAESHNQSFQGRADGHGAFGARLQWDPRTWSIEVTSTISSIAGDMYMVSFTVRNPIIPQESPALTARGYRMNLGGVSAVDLPAARVIPDNSTILPTFEVRSENL
jgi:hypothetical protein